MAGSYGHIITNSGNLGSNEYVADMLENGGDVFEGVEEMFGMIWFLAEEQVGPFPEDGTDEAQKAWANSVKESVEEARKNYKAGLLLSKQVHKVSPDTRRD